MLMALFPLLLTFFGVLQLSLFQLAHLVVQHAAFRAARAAVVVLDDDPKYYDGAPAGDLTAGTAETDSGFLAKTREAANDLANRYRSLTGDEKSSGGARLQEIRAAAYHPLAVLAPPPSGYLRKATDLKTELGGTTWARMVLGAQVYNKGAAVVTLHLPGDDVALQKVSQPRQFIEVRVSYLLRCGVPLVSALMCRSGASILAARMGLSFDEETKEISQRLRAAQSPLLRDTLLATGGRFIMLGASATLPAQGASYHKGGP